VADARSCVAAACFRMALPTYHELKSRAATIAITYVSFRFTSPSN
jgi:hypothetical protein